MKAEDKLTEAKFFLEKLLSVSRSIRADSQWEEGRDVYAIEPEFKYNFSAFIQAWRSTFDVLLYDYAEKYFELGPERDIFLDIRRFETVAKVLRNRGSPESISFIEWYKRKEDKFLRKERFWHLRVSFVHRGGKTLDTKVKEGFSWEIQPVYMPPSSISAGTLPPSSVRIGSKFFKVKTEREIFIDLSSWSIVFRLAASKQSISTRVSCLLSASSRSPYLVSS